MDIDISDILADVSRPESHYSHGSSSQILHETPSDLATSSHTDHQLLVRAWTAERCSPALLPYPIRLIERVMIRIRDHITKIEDMSSGVDSVYSIGAHNATNHAMGATGANKNLILSILQIDLSRTQFILRSYLRQRLAKITKYSVYYCHDLDKFAPSMQVESLDIRSNSNNNKNVNDHLLSSVEARFLQSHQALLSDFYDNSFLSSFPPNLRRLDDSTGGTNMIEGPDGGQGVIVRCLGETWDNVDEVEADDDGDTQHSATGKMSRNSKSDVEKADVELRFRRSEVWVVRWRDVRGGVVDGSLELL